MAFADASETTLAWVEETAWGTTPTSPAFQRQRFTAEGLLQNLENITSNEIDPSAAVLDLIQISGAAEGNIDIELSYGASDTHILLEHALRSTFSTGTLKRATEKKSMTLEKLFETGTPDYYFRFSGMRANQLSLTFDTQAICTGSVSFLGKGAVTATSAIAASTYNPANTADVMSATGVGSITSSGVAGSVTYSRIALNLTNNCRYQYGLTGSTDAAGIGYGRTEITGDIVAYFEDIDLYEEFAAGNEVSFEWVVSDGTNSYTFTLPRVKFSSGQVLARGNNQDVTVELQYQALWDGVTENTDLKIVAA